jgi:hypothetical protein
MIHVWNKEFGPVQAGKKIFYGLDGQYGRKIWGAGRVQKNIENGRKKIYNIEWE